MKMLSLDGSICLAERASFGLENANIANPLSRKLDLKVCRLFSVERGSIAQYEVSLASISNKERLGPKIDLTSQACCDSFQKPKVSQIKSDQTKLKADKMRLNLAFPRRTGTSRMGRIVVPLY